MFSDEVTLSKEGILGTLTIPSSASGIVVFSHGSGSGRLSPRNQQVARTLNDAGLGTLLFDLLTPAESNDRAKVFDIPFLAHRLKLATHWLSQFEKTNHLRVAYFGASTGAGAALWAAAELKDKIIAIVSRGGRPDLALPRLSEVTAPTLLLVGGWDDAVIEMNQEAAKALPQAKLVIIPEATHLFEERGKMEAVAHEAVSWFRDHFRSPRLLAPQII